MRVVCFVQAYNEQMFIKKHLEHILPIADKIIITEGLLSPHGNLPQSSTDGTCEEIEQFTANNSKTIAMSSWKGKTNTREKAEGMNKNQMLDHAGPDDGDLIFIADADEYFAYNSFDKIFDYFSKNELAQTVRCEEYQFAYGFKWWFKASHPRFIRYRSGARFGTTNHLIGVDGKNLTKQITKTFKLNEVDFYHFCWSKHPNLIRNKVLSFNRNSFTTWFNTVYLEWPDNPEFAYQNNYKIGPWHGRGYAEGQNERLRIFEEQLPSDIHHLTHIDWTDYIQYHKQNLRIEKK